MNSVLRMIFLCSDIYPILAIIMYFGGKLGQNHLSQFINLISMVFPNHKKFFYFTNNKSKRKNCSKYKQLFKSISWSGSGRILSGRSKYSSDDCSYIPLIHYSLPMNHDFTEPIFSHTSSAPDIDAPEDESHSHFILYWKMSEIH